MRILVTGSLGVLGRPLVSELRARGHEVWGCDLSHDPDPQYIRADVAEHRQLQQAFMRSHPDAVYHLAAEFGRLNGEAFTEQLWRTAMVGTRNVLEGCRQYGARLFFASSSEIYGDSKAEVFDEELPEREVIFHPNEYALSKWTNERQILSHQARHGTDVTRLRFFNSYGPGEYANSYRSVVALFCQKALKGIPLPVYRDYWRSFVYIDDFTPTLANVCEAELRHDVYNIGGSDFRSTEDLARIVLDAAGGGEVELIDEDRHNVRVKRADITRASEDLGHDPQITLEEGVPLTLAWMKETHGQEEEALQGRRSPARSR